VASYLAGILVEGNFQAHTHTLQSAHTYRGTCSNTHTEGKERDVRANRSDEEQRDRDSQRHSSASS